jgi:serine/threonine-protein kinase
MITAHLKTVPAPPSKAKPGIPPLMDQIILRLLEKQRDKRYANTEELRKDLARVTAGETGVAQPIAAAPPSAGQLPTTNESPGGRRAAPPTDKVAHVPSAPAAAGGPSKNMIFLVVGVVIAIAAILGAVLVFGAKH